MEKIFYHVTPKENLESIMKHGLSIDHLNPAYPTKEIAEIRLKEKGIDVTKINFSEPIPEPSYRKTGIKMIWLGDEGIIEKYRNSPVLAQGETVAFKVTIPEKWLKENEIPCPALYGCGCFEDWFEYTKQFTDPISRVIEGLGIRHTSREDMLKRYERRTRMTTVKATIPPEWLEIIEL